MRDGNGFDPKSSNRLWASSLNASLAFPLDVPLSVLDSTAAAFRNSKVTISSANRQSRSYKCLLMAILRPSLRTITYESLERFSPLDVQLLRDVTPSRRSISL